MAKTGLMKKYIKLANGDFKKAWRLQKAAQKKKPAKKKTVKKRTVKKARKKAPIKKRVVKKKVIKRKVVKKKVIKKTVKRKSVKRVPPKPGGRKMAKKRKKKSGGYKRRPLRNPIMDKMTRAGLAAAGAVGASIIAAKIPIKNPKFKAWIPAGVGAIAMFTKIGRQAAFQPILGGMFAATAFAVARQLLPANVPLLAGEDGLMLPDYSDYSDPDLYGADPYTPDLGQDQISNAEIDDMIDSEMMGAWSTPGQMV